MSLDIDSVPPEKVKAAIVRLEAKKTRQIVENSWRTTGLASLVWSDGRGIARSGEATAATLGGMTYQTLPVLTAAARLAKSASIASSPPPAVPGSA